MKKIIAVLILTISMPVFGFSGNDWRRLQASDEVMEKSVVFGYLLATHQWYQTYGLFGSCTDFPDEVLVDQIEKIVLKWMNKNPEKSHFPISDLYVLSMVETFGARELSAGGKC